MMKYVLAAAAFVLVACGNGNGVMAEIERAEKQETQAAEQANAQGADLLRRFRPGC